ncbi:TIGR01212 family radical SAM protein [candidate division TA06 bacterium]|uniref:TIGR01212 family radical SAM protein n=1 Tax=candidate division TA06 bacterium TaxID=2250710 RepID=A0A660SBU9_UNCT6|nr:MAG: TIGR01212 family radical SAM protein [candidate division TA06 bacterium]
MLRYNKFSEYLKRKYGRRVQKISVDAGLTCPVRDGILSRSGCFYCNSYGSGNASNEPVDIQIATQMEYYEKKYREPYFILYYQAYSNTYGENEYLKKLYDKVFDNDRFVAISIGTRPDCIDEEILKYLEKMNEKKDVWLELGLESASIKTLQKIGRMHGIASFVDGVNRIQKHNLNVCAHVIFGLPYDNSGDMLESAKLCSVLNVDAIKIHSFYLEKGTVFEKIYRSKGFSFLSAEKYVEIVVKALRYLKPDIVIQRLTGDPNRELLIGPEWTLNKHKIITSIESIMERNNYKQGDLSEFNYVKRN